METTPESIRRRADDLHEFSLMLDHRGCRLGVTYPEIMEMQTTAIVDAACIVAEEGIDVKPRSWCHLSWSRRTSEIREVIRGRAHAVFERRSVWVDVTIGTMLELQGLPHCREVAEHADFSFVTMT